MLFFAAETSDFTSSLLPQPVLVEGSRGVCMCRHRAIAHSFSRKDRKTNAALLSMLVFQDGGIWLPRGGEV